jgi:hypothetical protein
MAPPKIFDASLLSLARVRATKRQARRGRSFLYTRAAEDAASRIADIQRRFERAVLVGAIDGRETILAELPPDRKPEIFDHVETVAALEGPYDLILSILELQSDEALPDTLVVMRAKLSPDGVLLAATLGGETLTELRQSLYGADQTVLGGAAARVYPMVDYSQAAMLLGRVGLALPVVDSDRVQVHYGALETLVGDLRDLGLSNTLAARDRRALPRRWITVLRETYATHFAREDGKLRATFEILWLTGWAPHESQQKPLKPGSAKMRLADALKTKETKL